MSEHRRCRLEGCCADAVLAHESDIALRGGCGAEDGSEVGRAPNWVCDGAGTADHGLGLSFNSLRWLGEGVKLLGSSSASGVRFGLKKVSMDFVFLRSGVCIKFCLFEERDRGLNGVLFLVSTTMGSLV